MRTKNTSTMTRDQREAHKETRQEHRRLMRSLNEALQMMDMATEMALVAIARELAQPGTIEELLLDNIHDKTARRLGLV